MLECGLERVGMACRRGGGFPHPCVGDLIWTLDQLTPGPRPTCALRRFAWLNALPDSEFIVDGELTRILLILGAGCVLVCDLRRLRGRGAHMLNYVVRSIPSISSYDVKNSAAELGLNAR